MERLKKKKDKHAMQFTTSHRQAYAQRASQQELAELSNWSCALHNVKYPISHFESFAFVTSCTMSCPEHCFHYNSVWVAANHISFRPHRPSICLCIWYNVTKYFQVLVSKYWSATNELQLATGRCVNEYLVNSYKIHFFWHTCKHCHKPAMF